MNYLMNMIIYIYICKYDQETHRASECLHVVPGIAILRPRLVWLRVSVNKNQTSPSQG